MSDIDKDGMLDRDEFAVVRKKCDNLSAIYSSPYHIQGFPYEIDWLGGGGGIFNSRLLFKNNMLYTERRGSSKSCLIDNARCIVYSFLRNTRKMLL